MDHLPSPFSPLPLQNTQDETSSPPSSRTTSPPASPTTRKFTYQPTSHPEHHPEHHPISILPCAVLRGRSTMMVLRRRPSAIEMALSEEQSRCDGNAIERQGLDLMEPRPVMVRVEQARVSSESGSESGSVAGVGRVASTSTSGSRRGREVPVSAPVPVNQPRIVMGGIFEVMEGRA